MKSNTPQAGRIVDPSRLPAWRTQISNEKTKRKNEMKFDTKTLKENNGEKVGVFRNWNVIATTKKEFFNRENTQGAYLIWDDCNKLVFNGKVVGRITEQGRVEYIENEYRYVKPVLEEKPQVNNLTSGTGALVDGVAPGSDEVDLSKRTLADDILDNAFKMKLEELLA